MPFIQPQIIVPLFPICPQVCWLNAISSLMPFRTPSLGPTSLMYAPTASCASLWRWWVPVWKLTAVGPCLKMHPKAHSMGCVTTPHSQPSCLPLLQKKKSYVLVFCFFVVLQLIVVRWPCCGKWERCKDKLLDHFWERSCFPSKMNRHGWLCPHPPASCPRCSSDAWAAQTSPEHEVAH